MKHQNGKIVVLSGAGISAESGLKTFRDSGGLWEGHDVTKVATPQAFDHDPELVLEFYNQRRRQLKTVMPNKAHRLIADLEQHYSVDVVTQNVDDLHERAGSSNVLHLHGELFKVRSVDNPNKIYQWEKDLVLGDVDDQNSQLRPHVVWFGEAVPKMTDAIPIVQRADALIVIGTSLQVYPAAGLVDLAKPDTKIYLIDPNPGLRESPDLKIFRESATTGMEKLFKILIK
jgi:NAD-dependent deacetylase